MKLLILSVVLIHFLEYSDASGAAIVKAARSQIGVPYSWGGGSVKGKSKGIEQGAHTVGFDCSGLAQYAVHKGTGKTIARVASGQYSDKHCHHVAYTKAKPGDLVFFNDGGSIHHVGIISGKGKFIQASHTGDHVRESAVPAKGRMRLVTRCF